MLLYPTDNGMMQLMYLYQHFSAPFLPAGTATHLFHQLKRPLIHPKIGKLHQPIGINNAYQTHFIKMQSLYNHLSSNQNINLMLLK